MQIKLSEESSVTPGRDASTYWDEQLQKGFAAFTSEMETMGGVHVSAQSRDPYERVWEKHILTTHTPAWKEGQLHQTWLLLFQLLTLQTGPSVIQVQ